MVISRLSFLSLLFLSSCAYSQHDAILVPPCVEINDGKKIWEQFYEYIQARGSNFRLRRDNSIKLNVRADDLIKLRISPDSLEVKARKDTNVLSVHKSNGFTLVEYRKTEGDSLKAYTAFKYDDRFFVMLTLSAPSTKERTLIKALEDVLISTRLVTPDYIDQADKAGSAQPRRSNNGEYYALRNKILTGRIDFNQWLDYKLRGRSFSELDRLNEIAGESHGEADDGFEVAADSFLRAVLNITSIYSHEWRWTYDQVTVPISTNDTLYWMPVFVNLNEEKSMLVFFCFRYTDGNWSNTFKTFNDNRGYNDQHISATGIFSINQNHLAVYSNATRCYLWNASNPKSDIQIFDVTSDTGAYELVYTDMHYSDLGFASFSCTYNTHIDWILFSRIKNPADSSNAEDQTSQEFVGDETHSVNVTLAPETAVPTVPIAPHKFNQLKSALIESIVPDKRIYYSRFIVGDIDKNGKEDAYSFAISNGKLKETVVYEITDSGLKRLEHNSKIEDHIKKTPAYATMLNVSRLVVNDEQKYRTH